MDGGNTESKAQRRKDGICVALELNWIRVCKTTEWHYTWTKVLSVKVFRTGLQIDCMAITSAQGK